MHFMTIINNDYNRNKNLYLNTFITTVFLVRGGGCFPHLGLLGMCD